MKLGTFIQQPAERESYTVTYADTLLAGDNVLTVSAAVFPLGLIVDQVTALDPRVRFFVAGGIAGTSYKITLSVETADGRRFEDEVIIKVKEY